MQDRAGGPAPGTPRRLRIDGVETPLDTLAPDLREAAERLGFAEARLRRLENRHALLLRARNGYVADLRAEVVRLRSGLDLGGPGGGA